MGAPAGPPRALAVKRLGTALISRILSPVRTPAATIYLADANAGSRLHGCDYYPGIGLSAPGEPPVPPVLSCTASGLPCLFTYAQSGGLLPHHFTLTPESRNPRKRSIFCGTFRHRSLAIPVPPLSRGTLPCGVRTFLSQPRLQAVTTGRFPIIHRP